MITTKSGIMRNLLKLNDDLLQLGITSLRFETDCLKLVRLIEEEDLWKSTTSEFDEFQFFCSSFNVFKLYFIPCCLNVCADCLSKDAWARDCFFTYVNSLVPNW